MSPKVPCPFWITGLQAAQHGIRGDLKRSRCERGAGHKGQHKTTATITIHWSPGDYREVKADA
jgi:hypothetical protein